MNGNIDVTHALIHNYDTMYSEQILKERIEILEKEGWTKIKEYEEFIVLENGKTGQMIKRATGDNFYYHTDIWEKVKFI